MRRQRKKKHTELDVAIELLREVVERVRLIGIRTLDHSMTDAARRIYEFLEAHK
jgi:hypothetical protein